MLVQGENFNQMGSGFYDIGYANGYSIDYSCSSILLCCMPKWYCMALNEQQCILGNNASVKCFYPCHTPFQKLYFDYHSPHSSLDVIQQVQINLPLFCAFYGFTLPICVTHHIRARALSVLIAQPARTINDESNLVYRIDRNFFRSTYAHQCGRVKVLL